MSEDNPRLKDWLEKSKNPYDSEQRSIVTQSTRRKSSHVTHQVVTVESLQYVGFWRRFFAFFIDSIILGIVTSATHNLVVSFLLGALYYIVLTATPIQGTIGKLAIGAVVVDMNGNRLRIDKSFLRFLLFLLSGGLFLIGFLMVAFHGKKQGLHDMIARTLVINKR